MGHLIPKDSKVLSREIRDPAHSGPAERVALRFMVDASRRFRNAEAPWADFSSNDYWRSSYENIQPVDQETIRRVSSFFIQASASRRRARRAIDVGSGTNLYPALLMLPWAEQILLSDHSASNVRWLRQHVEDENASWTWQPFWRELHELEGYNRVSDPRYQLREACADHPGQGSGVFRECLPLSQSRPWRWRASAGVVWSRRPSGMCR
jgi:NNMT/PNMT/TEMT family